jgi:hypothetical protein
MNKPVYTLNFILNGSAELQTIQIEGTFNKERWITAHWDEIVILTVIAPDGKRVIYG